MSTSESIGPWDPVSSQELRVASSVLPTTGSVPTVNLPTPGVGLGVVRDPGGLPFTQQLDPVAFGQALALEATKLFSAPPHSDSEAASTLVSPDRTAVLSNPLLSFRGLPGIVGLTSFTQPSNPGALSGINTPTIPDAVPSATREPIPGSPDLVSVSPVSPGSMSPGSVSPGPSTPSASSPSSLSPGSLSPNRVSLGGHPTPQASELPTVGEPTTGSRDPARRREASGLRDQPSGTSVVNPFSVGPNLDALDTFSVETSLPWLTDLPDKSLVRSPFDDSTPVGATPATSISALDLNVPAGLQTDVPLSFPLAGLFDPYSIRGEFPILQERVNGRPLVWLDNAATTQKPREVIQRISTFYERENSNIHRAAHTLAARSTDAYEKARETVRRFIGAPSVDTIIFVRGATEGVNLVAQTFGRQHVKAGDEILITWLEHHANIVPWQQLCAATGAHLRVAPVDDRGQVILEEYERLLSPKTRLVAFTQVSNALGTITPAREMIDIAHRYGARVLLDGAQGISHMPVNVQALDCDFYVFSGHKVFAPTGIGVVYGKQELLDSLPPWQGGGNMIQDVTHERTLFHKAPARFEAGTGNIADAVGLGAALEWLSRVGVYNVQRYEHELLEYATCELLTVPGLRLIGTAAEKAGVLSFTLEGQKTESVGGLLDKEGIAVRSGHHCAQPILRRFGVEATVRASLAPYNTREDIDALVSALYKLQRGQNS